MSAQIMVEGLESKCKIGKLLGMGSFGQVYKVTYQEDGKVRRISLGFKLSIADVGFHPDLRVEDLEI
jgi:hypothetical protein